MTTTTLSMQQMLHDTVLEGRNLFNRFLAGFDDSTHTKQANGLPNHAAWTLGHCALVMHRVADRLDEQGVPESDFVTGDGTQGDSHRFDTEGVFIDSVPVDDPSMYPSWDRCRGVFDAACERLARAALESDEKTLCKRSPWLDQALPRWQLVQRALMHNGVHSGQLIDLRRALEFDRVIVLPRSDD